MRTAPAALLTAAALAFASPVLADEPVRPDRSDPGEYPPPEARVNLLVAGAGITAAWYGIAVGFSYLWPGAPGADDLRIPVAGPWMALADTGCAEDSPGCSTFTVVLRAILTTIDGVGQVGGVAAMIEGALLPTQERSKQRRRAPVRLRREGALELRPVPYAAGRDGVGIGILGVF